MRLDELHTKVNAIVPIHGLSMSENGTVVANYINPPSPEDEAAVNAILANAPLEAAKAEKLAALDAEWKQTMTDGWETPYGWKLGMDTQDISLLTGLFMLAKEAAALGITDPVTVIDVCSDPHQLSLQDFTVLMLQYGNARAVLSASYASRRTQVKDATTIEELEGI